MSISRHFRFAFALFLASFHFAAEAGVVADKHPRAAQATKPKPSAAKAKSATSVVASTSKRKPVTKPAVPQVQPVVVPEQAVILRGLIKSETGLPLPGATVWVTGNPPQIAVSNADGSFTLLLPNSKPVHLSYGCGGFEEQQQVVSQPATGEVVQVSLITVRRKPQKQAAPANVFAVKR